jgi:hypothetical protein
MKQNMKLLFNIDKYYDFKFYRNFKGLVFQPYAFVALSLFLFIGVSCNRNHLKTDEKALTKQILTEEEQLAHEQSLREEREKHLMDSIAKLPKGFRFPENRSIDPQQLPVVIDIIGSRSKNPKEIKLSQLFSKVEYIRLEQTQDSLEFTLGIQFIVTPNHIYVKSGKGSIFQYDKEGHFVRTVCTGNLQFTSYKGGMMVSKEQADLFEGAQEVYWNGNKLCYQYENRPAQKSYLLTFDDNAGPEISSFQLPGSIEGENRINGSGEILTELKKDPSLYSFPSPFLVGNNTLAFAQRRKPVRNPVNFIDVISTTGDTLCEFEDNDPIKNFSKSVYRGVDGGDTYYQNGVLHIRQSFNDTIYRLIPPNRLIPKYILDFGELGIKSANQGIDPGVDLSDKLVPQSFLETDRYLFIVYSKDYDCPNTAKSGTLKYSKLMYDKKNKTLIPIYIDEAAFVPKGRTRWPSAPDTYIENDLDAMPFKWPSSVTGNGNPFSSFSGEELLKIKEQDLPFKNISKNDRVIAIYH